MKQFITTCCLLVLLFTAGAQQPKTYTSSEILLQLKKLNVLGSVLYIAAHPDDENTRLLAYLANEKLYRTGYLSLTRGDGGQNLIGNEQGIDLGLIRTQELLAARRIDGAEQFFSRAFDFGFCKSPEEALATWGHDKILSDVVWVIRKFKPDVIIARFPEDGRAGHGHHAASGILAREAFDAAADPAKFPEQLTQGVTVWQAKRMLWNTYNFGGNSTQKESQFKVEVGMYNPMLGKSYGEIAALSRSQHKSQGFGVPAQRGSVLEYFETIRGDKPVNDLMDGVDVSWNRVQQQTIADAVTALVASYNPQQPANNLQQLVSIYASVQRLEDSYWKQQKLKELKSLVEACSGLFIEATAANQYAVQGDSVKINVSVNNRLGVDLTVKDVSFLGTSISLAAGEANVTASKSTSVLIAPDAALSQPYWLVHPMEHGSFTVTDQQLIGKAEDDPLSAVFHLVIDGQAFDISKPIRYKYTDPVKGEIYTPVYIVPALTLNVTPALEVLTADKPAARTLTYRLFTDGSRLNTNVDSYQSLSKLQAGARLTKDETFDPASTVGSSNATGATPVFFNDKNGVPLMDIAEIDYDHIPPIRYFKPASQKIMFSNVKVVGKTVGYIPGAGDKIPEALEQMGYKVVTLKEADITASNLEKFDAVVTGVRAYNTNDWMGNVYNTLMQYINNGGVLVTQYNTSNFISSVKSKIGPYPFSISRTRVTDENAKVKFLQPANPVLNYPNKITEKDFDGWIQERSTYHAEKADSNYQHILSMSDAGESADDGSLIIANYGKGKFVYTGLVFFRELPAGVPGAYRLFANLLAPPPVAGATSPGRSTHPPAGGSTIGGKTSKQ